MSIEKMDPSKGPKKPTLTSRSITAIKNP
jgi:hypothetical protein